MMRTIPKPPASVMKSPNANNKALLLLCCTCGLLLAWTKPGVKKLSGVWEYKSVLHRGQSMFSICNDDTMVLDRKSNFRYDILAPMKHMQGTWKLIAVSKDSTPTGKAIQLSYQNINLVRTFYIMPTNLRDSLCIREKEVFFTYHRRR